MSRPSRTRSKRTRGRRRRRHRARVKHIKKNAVTTAKIRNRAVTAAKRTRPEPFHIVGAPGEPPFANGGEADCLWQNPPSTTDLLGNVKRTSFFKDADGIVHLAGLPLAVNGPGGDMTCGGADLSDLAIFRLPAGYRPGRLEVFASGNTESGST